MTPTLESRINAVMELDWRDGRYGAGQIYNESTALIRELTARLAVAREALQQCDEAMEYMSEYDIPLCLPENVKKAATACDLSQPFTETHNLGDEKHQLPGETHQLD